MGIFVYLAAFLLVASATPIENLSGDSPDEPFGNHDEVSRTDAPSFSDGDGASTGSQDFDGDDTSTQNKGPASSSEISSVSTEDNTANNTGEEDVTASASTVSTASTENNTTDQSEFGTPSTLVTTDSTTSTIRTTNEDADSTNITEPADGDPVDCKTRHPETHVYLLCQFECGGDMMELAPDNSTCLLNYTAETGNISVPQGYNYTNSSTIYHEGVCENGVCVPRAAAQGAPVSAVPTKPETNSASSNVTEKEPIMMNRVSEASDDVATPEPEPVPVRD